MTNYAMALQPVVQKDMEKTHTRFANEGVRGFGQKKTQQVQRTRGSKGQCSREPFGPLDMACKSKVHLTQRVRGGRVQ